MPDTLPKVYVVPTGSLGGDITGCLLLESGEVLWSHCSSSIEWLRIDLTNGFTNRRATLGRLFPNGYDVVVADSDDAIPVEVIERNRIWGEKEEGPDERSADA